jgi:hypothetical protein
MVDTAATRTSRPIAWLLLAVAALLLASLAAYWYMSPVLALREFQKAAQARDAGRLNGFIDYPLVRESLKVQFGIQEGEAKTGESPWASMGSSLRRALVGGAIDQLVRPEVLFMVAQTGKLAWPARASTPPAPPAAAAAPAAPASAAGATPKPAEQQRPSWRLDRVGFNRVVARPTEADPAAAGEPVRFVFDRSGFDTWRLTAIELPQSAR